MNQLTIKIATSESEKLDVFKFRYEVGVQNMA